MPDAGSPPPPLRERGDAEQHLPSSDLASPSGNSSDSPSLRDHDDAAAVRATSSSPAIPSSSLHASPRHLDFMPNPPSPGSAAPSLQPDMASGTACLREPNPPATTCGQITLPQATSGLPRAPTMHRPQLPRDTLDRSTAAATKDRRAVPCLSEITHLLRVQKYHKRRCVQAQEELHRLQIATAKCARLRLTAPSVQHTLAECIRSEDRSSFASLLHAFQDACEDAAAKPSPPPYQERLAAAPKPFESFLGELTGASRAVVLDVLAKLRCDGQFLAERITALTPRELNALVPERSAARSSDSIFASSTRSSRTARPLGYAVDAQVDVLGASSFGSPLETLVFAPAPSILSDAEERRRATDVWATVCAKVIAEQKPGSEKLVPALLNLWSTFEPWLGKDRLETWMLQTLQRGAFVLEQPSKQTFRARMEGRPDLSAQDEARIEAFFVDAAESLLALFGDQHSPSVIPPGALMFCQAISQKLQHHPSHQRALPSFILTRWMFNSFIMDLVTLPEAHLMTTDHYVSDLSRQRILREIAIRAQKAVFDVAYYWKHGNLVMAETANRVNSIMARLTGAASQASRRRSRPVPDAAPFLVISSRDLTTILATLYPQRRPISISSDYDLSKTGLQSSASSISGFSLFRNAKTPEQNGADTTYHFHSHGEAFNSTANDTKPYEDCPDDVQLREAWLELEDLATRRTSSSRESWDIIAVAADGQTLCTMREKCSNIRHAQRLHFLATNPQLSLLDTLDAHDREIAHALKLLLFTQDPLQSSESYCNGTAQRSDTWQQLEGLFENAVQESQSCGDYVEAQSWFQRLHSVHAKIFAGDGASALHHILCALQGSAQRSISELSEVETVCEHWAATLQPASLLHNLYLKPIIQNNEALRDKMWYVTDVRTSAHYEEVRLVTSALRIMGKPSKGARPRTPQPLRHWSTSRISTGSMHLKSEAQILDLLSARCEHGGPNKLSDEQSKAVISWMQRESIDNLCRGEERLHKLLFEIRKCVDVVSSNSSADNSLLWSNTLFARDTALRARDPMQRKSHFLPNIYGTTLSSDYLSLSSQLRSNDCLSTTSHTLSNSSSRDYLDARSPTLTNRSSIPFWSPAMSEVDSPSSATSVASSQTQWAPDAASIREASNSVVVDSQALEKLRQRVTSLMLSDLTATLFSDGSETDLAFWTGLGQELAERHFRSMQNEHSSAGSQTPTTDFSIPARPAMTRFDFDSAFENLMQKFVASSNPTAKLACLYDIERLLVPYMRDRRNNISPSTSFVKGTQDLKVDTGNDDATETSIAGFRNLFAKNSLRPKTVFKDLQSIASLLPASVLQNTPQGKAFTNAAVAITSLKTEVRKIMVETAESIIAYHSNNRGHGRSSSTAQQERDFATFAAPSPPAEDVARYSMADAAHLLQVTAKEGDIVAQRELATLYLTHPELMDRIIAPFARPKDVFKDELEGKWKKNQDPHRMDPITMCVAHHWMSLSSKGGDSFAKEILRQQEEMNSF